MADKGLMQALAAILMLAVPCISLLGLLAVGGQSALPNPDPLSAQVAQARSYSEDASAPQWAGLLSVRGEPVVPSRGQQISRLAAPLLRRGAETLTVVIDPGHGGRDPGAVHFSQAGRLDLTERDANLDIAQRLKRYLDQLG